MLKYVFIILNQMSKFVAPTCSVGVFLTANFLLVKNHFYKLTKQLMNSIFQQTFRSSRNKVNTDDRKFLNFNMNRKFKISTNFLSRFKKPCVNKTIVDTNILKLLTYSSKGIICVL